MSYFLIIVGLAPLVIGTVVLVKGRKHESSLFYFLIAFSCALYEPPLGLFEVVHSPVLASMLFNMYSLGGTVIILSLLYFAITFSLKKTLPVLWAIFLAIPTVILSGVVVSGSALAVDVNQFATPGRGLEYLPMYFFIVFYAVLYCTASFLILQKKYFGSAGVFRQKSKTILLIVFAAGATAVTTNVILPFFSGNNDFLFVGPVLISAGLYYLGYLIASYHVWDIKIFATEVFTALFVVALGGSVFFADSVREIVIKSIFFILTSTAALLLLRSVKNEASAAERVERLMRKLAERHEKLETLNRRTSAFVTSTANQLRDPLSGIRWHSSSLLQGTFGNIPEQSKEYISRIFESSKRLIVIVDDFLDLRKIEQGQMKYTFAFFDMKALVTSVVEEMTPMAKEKKLSLVYEDNREDHYALRGDQGKLRQVVSNLIDNSVKYTDAGEVRVYLEKIGDPSAQGGKIRLSVSDHGIGILPDEIETLFHKFSRTIGAKKINTTGSGLGLYVAAEIMRAHGGKIWAESAGHGKGSKFTLELPAGK
ncbi:MAG TPA: ATP-binding protein [Candidatus Paceibacterota bacterium]|nr:ATP-binding protein [Candidatus Paceibacterota bacterium]